MNEVEMRYPDVMRHGEHVTTAFIEMIYRQARSSHPITFGNITFVLRHPKFALQMLWFSAKLLGVLYIDGDRLREIYGVGK